MTLDEFRKRYRHKFMGYIADGLMQSRSKDAWKHLEDIAKLLDEDLEEAYKAIVVYNEKTVSPVSMLRDAATRGTKALEASWKSLSEAERTANQAALAGLKADAAKADAKPLGEKR